jgi:hypothetical protein
MVRFAAASTLAFVFALPAAAQRQTLRPTGPVGVISGRVTASGNPSVGALVTILREHDPFNIGIPFLSPRDVRLVAGTNRRGEYRLADVPAGRYFLVALPPMTRVAPADRRGHAVTYYPGALESSEAREIAVGGGESVEADIRLIPRRVSVISGVAIGSTGRPLSSGIVQLGFGAPLFGVGGTSLAISRDGSFTSPVLPPGVYSLQTTDGQGARAMSQVPNPVMSGARVTLAEADVTGVRLEPIRMVTVRGRVLSTAGVSVQGLTVGATPMASGGPMGPQRPGTVDANGNFEFRTWPGRVFVRVFPATPPPPGSGRGRSSELRSRVVRLNGADVTKTGIEVRPARDVAGMVIELGR